MWRMASVEYYVFYTGAANADKNDIYILPQITKRVDFPPPFYISL